MSLRPIYLLGSPVLRQRSDAVGPVDDTVRAVVDDLFETMHADRGIGLAANQIGIARRVAVVEVDEGDRVVLIDPEIVERQGKAKGEEGCLSIPDIFGDVERSQRIVVETTTLDNARVRLDAADLKARAIQHEIDHLDGILFLDRLSPLKRRMLMKKWQKSREGQPGLIKIVTPEAETSAKR
jgi:peptide deformylase